MSTEAIKKMLTVQEDKVPIIVLTKLSPDYIEASKAPKKLRATVLNQYMRCVKFYVETTINNVSPLMKNTEHYEPKIPTIKPKHISKITLDEAREFIGNVELTKRTRNQQKEIHSVSQPDENEKICILSETEVKGLKRTRSASLYSPNCVEIEVTKCIASTNNLKDNATKSVKAQQISRDNYNFAEDLHSVFKKCKLSAKVKQKQQTSSVFFSTIVYSRRSNHNQELQAPTINYIRMVLTCRN